MNDPTHPMVLASTACGDPRRYGMLSTFPPTRCGLATFSAALADAIISTRGGIDIVRCAVPSRNDDPSTVAEFSDVARGRLHDFVEVLNGTDVVIAQHEFGLYPGADGCEFIDIVNRLTVPTIAVVHTVPGEPTAGQRAVLERVCVAVDAVVVMTKAAHFRLTAGFDVDASKIVTIPHGAATETTGRQRVEAGRQGPPRLLTWGLLGPGKGIEWAIDAVAELASLSSCPRYLVSGATHPNVLAHSGEAYRQMLEWRAASSAAAPWVEFDNRYRDSASLLQLISSADLIVLPYDSTDQVTSGVLVDAIAAGRPVVATAFPHAVELLGSGAGIVVSQRDPSALARAIRTVLTDTDLGNAMAAEAQRLAPELSWTSVAARYCTLAAQLVANKQPVSS